MAASEARAQAWVGPQHDLTLSLTSGYSFSDTTLEGDLRVSGVDTHSITFVGSVEYVPLPGLAVRVTLPVTMGAYAGPRQDQLDRPNPNLILDHGDNDDGDFGTSVTDLALDIRYMALELPIAVTPFIRGSIPLVDYEQRGYAAFGQGLKTLSFGLNLGRFGLGVDTLFVHANYAFTLVEKEDVGGEETSQYNLHRSEASFLFGWFPIDELGINVGVNFLWTHGGFNLIEFQNDPPPSDVIREWHDPIRQQKYLLVGGGISYSVLESLSLDLLGRILIWGDNTANAKLVQLGITWSANLF